MSKVKVSEQKTTLKSWSEVDSELQEIAAKKTTVASIESNMNEALLKVQERYQDRLNEENAIILGKEKNIELFCIEHKEEFGDKKSKELNFGIVSFRKGTGTLATLKGFTWEAVKKLVLKTKKYKDLFIKITETLNKQAILSAKLSEKELASIGCYVNQEESFSYEVFYKESKPLDAKSA